LPERAGGCFYRLLRPEFLQYLKSQDKPALSSDALTRWGMEEQELHNPDVVAATKLLVTDVRSGLILKLHTFPDVT